MKYQELRALLRRRFSLPKERELKRTIGTFTFAERAVFYFFAVLFVLSGLSLLWQTSDLFLVEVPSIGGTLTEGVIGNPRFINPVLALSEADKNLTSLVYSGLVHVTPSGKIENELASSISISDDLITYTVSIRDEAYFHDGTPVTSEDVLFTIQKITDPLIKSPRRGNWEGVTVSAPDEKTVTFTLKKPYAPFIYNLSTGILPKHIWKNVTADEFSFSQFNTLPVGSGPYQIKRVERNDGGIPDYYKLESIRNGYNSRPYVKNLVFRFYSSEETLISAYKRGDIESLSGLSPERLSELDLKDTEIVHSPLPRIFAVFFNQSRSKVLSDKSVREALELIVPREEIIKEVFDGYAHGINSPLPAGLYDWTTYHDASSTLDTRLLEAKEILSEGGWNLNENTGLLEKKIGSDTMDLSFSISTGDAPELKEVGELLSASWSQLGAQVEILVFETGELNQSVIRPRNFDALLFGEMVGRDADLYPFWHSSQRNDPGLNIALYANSRADKLLEEARAGKDETSIEETYRSLVEEINKDRPAIFLYTPSFIYVIPEKLKEIRVGSLLSSQDRFAGIREWYIETDRVWKIFLD